MADHEHADIEGVENPGKTIEESYSDLVEEGILSDDAEGAATETPEAPAAKDSMAKFRKEDGSIDVDKLAKSYENLEKLRSGKAPEEDAEGDEGSDEGDVDDVDNTNDGPTEADREFAEEVAEEAGLSLADLNTEFAENGELSAESYEALANAGYPQEAVDNYIAGLTAGQQAIAHAAVDLVGGSQNYDAMLDWAVDNLPDEDAAAFDEAVNSKNKATVLQAVRALHAQYAAASDDGVMEPEEQLGGKPGGNAGTVYMHDDELQADMADPRYESSEAFRQGVMQKLARTEAARGRR